MKADNPAARGLPSPGRTVRAGISIERRSWHEEDEPREPHVCERDVQEGGGGMKRRLATAGPPLAALLLFIGVWQIAVMLFDVEKWMLPSPLDIAREAAANGSGILLHALATLKLMLIGFGTGAGIGLTLACLLHPLPWLKRAIYPLIILSQNVPTIALLPLLMLWFGFGLLPKVIVIALVCFFPVCVAALDGLTQTDRTMLHYMRMTGATRAQLFWKLELPHALPSVFSGLKIAATYSVMGAVIAEWLGTDQGIGYYMMLQKAAYRVDRMFLGIVVIILLSLAMFGAIRLLERMVIRWRPEENEK